MFAQLGELVFEPLTGFDSYSETEEAVNMQYELINGAKPTPVFMGVGLRQLSIGMRWRQEFIIIGRARALITGYLQHGDVVALTWGNGEVEGHFTVSSLNSVIEQMDGLGNIYGLSVTVGLLEAPDEQLFSNKQKSALKKAVGNDPTLFADRIFVAPSPFNPRNIDKFLGYVRRALALAAKIDAIGYGGQFPPVGLSLPGLIADAEYNVMLMQSCYSSFGSEFELPDLTHVLSNVASGLADLAAISAVADQVAWQAANSVFQGYNRALCL